MLVGFTSRKELSNIYKCDVRKTRKILKDIGITHRLQLAPIEVELFRQKVGDLVKL
jgi:hypothetical protein